MFDADRLIDLLVAFEEFTEDAKSARGNLDLDPEYIHTFELPAAGGSSGSGGARSTSTMPDRVGGLASSSGGPPLPLSVPGWQLPPVLSSPGVAGVGGPVGALAGAGMALISGDWDAIGLPALAGGSGRAASDEARTREALR